MKYKASKYNAIIKQDEKEVIIFNTISGGICSFDPESYNDLINVNESSQYFSTMIDQGYLVPDTLDETQKLMNSHFSYIYDKKPEKMQYTIALTMRCPLNCIYCFENHHSGPIMTLETAQKVKEFIFREIKNNDNCKHLHITWFGGEPLLAPDIIEYLGEAFVSFCKEKNITFTAKIITNGVLFKPEIFDNFIEKGIITSVQFTLDGNEETTKKVKKSKDGMFDTMIEGIKYSATKILTNVRLNVTKYNQEELLEVVESILKDTEKDSQLHFYSAPLVDYNTDESVSSTVLNESKLNDFKSRLTELLNKYERYSFDTSQGVKIVSAFCGAMRLCNISIGPCGEFYKCENLIGNEKYIMGDVDTGIWHNEAMYKLPLSKISEKCKNCLYLPVCWGGCPVHANIYKHEFDCEGFKKDLTTRLLIKANINLGKEDLQNEDTC